MIENTDAYTLGIAVEAYANRMQNKHRIIEYIFEETGTDWIVDDIYDRIVKLISNRFAMSTQDTELFVADARNDAYREVEEFIRQFVGDIAEEMAGDQDED
jgi:hypothetical protein